MGPIVRTGTGGSDSVQPVLLQPNGSPDGDVGGTPTVQPAPSVSPSMTVPSASTEPEPVVPDSTTPTDSGSNGDASNVGETTDVPLDTSAPVTEPTPSTPSPEPDPADSTSSDETQTDVDTSDVSTDASDDTTSSEQPAPTEDIECPADATFCTGFELSTLPVNASFEPKHIADMLAGNVFDGTQLALDSQNVHSGSQSLHVPAGSGGYEYRMLAVPVPATPFWVRLYVRTSTSFGDGSHDTLYMGSRLPKGEYNGDTAVEISEQSMQLLLNTKDSLYAASGPGDPAGSGASGPVLPANTWICMETRFDADAIDVYADGELLIQASNYGGQASYETFRFGYLSFNDARSVWYDDVVVASSRIGCN